MTDNATIHMPKEMLEKWLAALRSGKYKQATGALEKDGGYCCLGVLQMCVDGKVEMYYASGAGVSGAEGLPTTEWLQSNSIAFSAYAGNGPDQRAREPYLPTLNLAASTANDGDSENRQYTFAQIADAIEACAVGE